MSPRWHARLAATAGLTGALLVLAGPALAHPAMVPDEVPLAGGEVELVLPHGCARQGVVPDDGVGLPTDEVVLRPSVAGVVLTALPAAGWAVLEDLDDGEAGWRHLGEGQEGVVRLPVRVEGDGTPHAARVLVHQACDDVAFRWVQDTGDTPSAVLGVGTVAMAHEGHDVAATRATEEQHATHDMADVGDMADVAGASPGAGEVTGTGEPVVTAGAPTDAAPEQGGGAASALLATAVAAATACGATVLAVRRRREDAAPTARV